MASTSTGDSISSDNDAGDRRVLGANQLLGLFVPPDDDGEVTPMMIAPHDREETDAAAATTGSLSGMTPSPRQLPEEDEHLLPTPHARSRPLHSRCDHDDYENVAAAPRDRSTSLADLFLPASSLKSDTNNDTETTSLLQQEQYYLKPSCRSYHAAVTAAQQDSSLDDSMSSANFMLPNASRPKSTTVTTRTRNNRTNIGLANIPSPPSSSRWQVLQNKLHLHPSTLAGSLMFLLYHVVFCLANASAIIRPHHDDNSHAAREPILGVMAKLSTIGIMVAGPCLIYRLGHDIPALFPSMDLFLAPFLAQAAIQVDASLLKQSQDESYSLDVFLGSFVVLVAIGMMTAATLLQLAAKFKLASLGTYLPYSVLCGFFSAVGVLLWALAFSVDNGGLNWKKVFFSGDIVLIWHSMMHHLPTVCVGIVMHKLGPKNPFFVILLIVVTLVGFYAVMWATGTSLQAAQEQGWFWSQEELVYEPPHASATTTTAWSTWVSILLPPAPFDNFASLLSGYVNWTAVYAGLENMMALALLYLLRSSIHASAMKKNVSNLVRRLPVRKAEIPGVANSKSQHDEQSNDGSYTAMKSVMMGGLRESVTIVNLSMADRQSVRVTHNGLSAIDTDIGDSIDYDENEQVCVEMRPKTPRMTLEEIFKEYSYGLYLAAFCGAFGVCPTVATSNTMYAIGAEGPAPQYGSIFLLFFVYCTNFNFVRFVPKAAFSALLVLGAVDTLVVWFLGAYRKTQDLTEWLVVPIIVIFSLWIGFLKAILIGLALSSFVFVAAFFRVGVVKFSATGVEIRSRIERTMAQSTWLDMHGDSIQILVLQNYLFFGNASSILNYISTMFEEVDDIQSDRFDFSLPPIPKILLIDMSLITGMDTSTTDIFKEIRQMCIANDCQLFLSGLSTRMRSGLALGGIIPEKRTRGKRRMTLFFADLDTALGKAEDVLIQYEMTDTTEPKRLKSGSSGFELALNQIDELLDENFTESLLELQRFVVPLELQPGERLFESDGGIVNDGSRGLFFIESGLLKIERDSSHSLTHTRTFSRHNSQQQFTIKREHARTGAIAARASLAIAKGMLHGSGQQALRLARIGPGWVCGTYEHASGLRPSGITVAVTRCRLHHLPFDRLEQIEQANPALVLKLYKMLSHLMARREEITIEHLSTLHNIMSSPAHSKPLSRIALQALKS